MALNKIYLGGEVYSGGGSGTSAEISKEIGNALVQKADGLYVPAGSVEISQETGNIITAKADGIFASVSSSDSKTQQAVKEIIADDIETENIDFDDFFN